MKRPPVVATWLLLRLATHRSNEVLAGDLTEEFQRHPSRLWFWRQTVVAVLMSWWADVRAHKLLTLRAIALGMSVLSLYLRYAFYSVTHFDEWLFSIGLLDHLVTWPPWASWMAGMAGACGCFWLVGRFHRPSMVFVFFVLMLLWDDVSRLVWQLAAQFPPAPFSTLVGALLVFTVFRLPMLVVGLWAAQRRQARPEPGS